MANRASGWTERASGAFSGLKDRLSGSSRRDDGYDDGAYDDYGYDDYGEYGYTDDYGEYGYDSAYEDDYTSTTASVFTRDSGGYSSNARLVSADDARASMTGVGADAANRASYRDSHPATPAEKARSRGYDSMFASTAAAAASNAAASQSSVSSSAATQEVPMPSLPIFDPPASNRSMKVIKPQQYSDAAEVTMALKAGNAVVLSMMLTPADLSKRVLDFSFGAASALDARVDCLCDRVFFISKGEGITDAERVTLQSQGVIK